MFHPTNLQVGLVLCVGRGTVAQLTVAIILSFAFFALQMKTWRAAPRPLCSVSTAWSVVDFAAGRAKQHPPAPSAGRTKSKATISSVPPVKTPNDLQVFFVPFSRFLPAHWMSWLFSAEFHVFIVITTALVMKQDLRWETVGVDACEPSPALISALVVYFMKGQDQGFTLPDRAEVKV